MDDKLDKELEEILKGKGVQPSAGERFAPCKNYRGVPPPGCILGWDIQQCNFCSHYEGIKREEK